MNVYELTEMQKEILRIERGSQNKAVSNLGVLVIFQRRLDLQIMKKALQAVIRNNDIFALRLHREHDQYLQFFSAEVPENIMCIEFFSKIYSWMANDMQVGFDLSGPLYKFVVLGINSCSGYYLKLHNLIADSESLATLVLQINTCIASMLKLPATDNSIKMLQACQEDLGSCYAAVGNAAGGYQEFKTYLQSQKKYTQSLQRYADKAYWLHEASYWQAGTGMRSVAAENGAKYTAGVSARVSLSLSLQESVRLRSFCAHNGVSLTEFTETVMALYLAHLKGADLAVICALKNDRRSELELSSPGLYSIIVPLHIVIDREKTFKKLCIAVHEKNCQANKHGMPPLAAMLEMYSTIMGSGCVPFEVMIAEQSRYFRAKQTFRVEWLDSGYAKLPLLIVVDGRQKIGYVVDYQTEVFMAAEVQQLFISLKNIISQVMANQNMLLKDIDWEISEAKQY